jgi:DNA polymerase
VGPAGRFLDELLASVGIKREDVYITNIVKDRPPMNRDPLPSEIEIYAQFLDRQIEIIRPKIIATLGRFSMEYIMNVFGLSANLDAISKLHGKVFEARAPYGTIHIIPLYHPAAAIYNQHLKETLKKDFQILTQFNA